ncbi:MAG: HD domain-containing phosphohydrolase [Curvibacter sp.]|jgi:response regulator RpfG family c-di-GMP phosphodiesterase|nr:response regulator [Curvibacter sp.]
MRIVIVDDVETNLVLLRHFIAQLGEPYEVLSFTDPALALTACRQKMPDLLIVDYMMPGLNGIDLIRQLRSTPGRADVPVLMVTANDETEVRRNALEAGANDFLTKPLDKVEFRARMRNTLALRASQKRLEDRASWLAEEVLKATEEIARREHETIVRLSRAAEFRDPETGDHIQRMAHYSWMIAVRMGLPLDKQQLILDAAPMHDVGKVGIPDHILLKPGELTDEELTVMKQHPVIGHSILAGSSSPLLQMAADIALSHHEKFDGSGYPLGKKGEDIPIVGRIVAVADVFDALTSARPYKPAWEMERALNFMREQRGRHFDPDCVDIFLGQLDEVNSVRARFAADY